MRHFLRCAPAFTLSILVALLTFASIGCHKETSEPGSNPAPSQTFTGIAGKYVAGIKRSDDVVELFRLDLNRQGNDISGVLDYLSSMLDSIDAYANNLQKVDVQVFENFAERPVKINGKVDGNSIDFSSNDPLV